MLYDCAGDRVQECDRCGSLLRRAWREDSKDAERNLAEHHQEGKVHGRQQASSWLDCKCVIDCELCSCQAALCTESAQGGPGMIPLDSQYPTSAQVSSPWTHSCAILIGLAQVLPLCLSVHLENCSPQDSKSTRSRGHNPPVSPPVIARDRDRHFPSTSWLDEPSFTVGLRLTE